MVIGRTSIKNLAKGLAKDWGTELTASQRSGLAFDVEKLIEAVVDREVARSRKFGWIRKLKPDCVGSHSAR